MALLPTLRQIQYFLALADTLSFVRAAERCNVTQPTLSAGLKELETLLGDTLFERSPRGVQLTRTGIDLLLPARDLMARAEEFAHTAQRNRLPLSGPLTLGIIPTIAPYILPHLLPSLNKHFPELQLQLREDLTGRLLEALERGEIDVVLMAFPFDTPHAEQMILWHEPFFLASPGTEPASAKTARIDDLKGANVLLLEDGHCLRDHAMAACHLPSNGQQRKTFGATSLATLVQMVQHGYGITLLPAMAIDPHDPPKGITIQRFANPQPSRAIGIAWRKRAARRQEYEMLGEFIVKTIRKR